MLGLYFPNRISTATVSGGNWVSSLPASNSITRPIAQVARSIGTATTDATLQYTLDASYTIKAVGVKNHNLSSAGQWRVKIGSTLGASDIYYSGDLTAWPGTFEATFVSLGMEDSLFQRSGLDLIHVLPQAYITGYLTVVFNDPSNSNGYIQVGRVFAGGGFTPTLNASYGLKDSWRDLSSVDHSEGGAFWFNARRRLRSVSFVLEQLSLTEGATLHEMQRILGTIDEVLYVPDITDPAYSQRFGFLGTMRQLDEIYYPYFNRRHFPMTIDELG